MNFTKQYLIVSGEGERASKSELVDTTTLGIKQRLTRERCGGDRWAWAVCTHDLHRHADGYRTGYDTQGNHRTIYPALLDNAFSRP